MDAQICVSREERVRVALLLEELALMLQWQWTLRRKGWQDQDSSIELAAEFQSKRVTIFMRRLRKEEPWLHWEVAEGTEDIVESVQLGIRCVPPPAKPWFTPTVPVVPSPVPTATVPVVPSPVATATVVLPAVPIGSRGWTGATRPGQWKNRPGQWVPRRGPKRAVLPPVAANPAPALQFVPRPCRRLVTTPTPAGPTGWVARGGRFFD